MVAISSGTSTWVPSDRVSRGCAFSRSMGFQRSEEHTSELQSLRHLVCRLLLEKKQRATLETYARGRRAPAPIRLRSWIVLLAAEYQPQPEIARLLSIVPRTSFF